MQQVELAAAKHLLLGPCFSMNIVYNYGLSMQFVSRICLDKSGMYTHSYLLMFPF